MSEDQSTRKRSFNSPIVHQEFSDLGNERHILKVRLLQYQNVHFDKPTQPKLDIRQFLKEYKNPDGTIYTGYTQRGVSLGWDDLQALKEIIDEALELMDSLGAKEKKGK
jgi:hypothetical protein